MHTVEPEATRELGKQTTEMLRGGDNEGHFSSLPSVECRIYIYSSFLS